LAYDRLHRRRLFVPALFLGALSTAVYALTTGFWPLFVGRLVWGVSWSFIWVGGATMILDVSGAADRGRWMGLYQTWFFLGSAAGSFLGGFLTDRIGYTNTMWVGAAVTALGGIAALLLLPETWRGKAQPHHATAHVLAPLALRSNAGLWAAVTLYGINRFVGYGVLAATIALLVQQQIGAMSPAIGVATVTGVLLSSRTLFSMAAAPLAGTLSDRSGQRWLVMAGAVLAGAAGVLLMADAAIVAILIGIVLAAISGGAVQSLATTLTGDVVAAPQRGRAIGLLHTAGDLGSALGPPVAYALLPLVALSGAYLLCAVLLSGALVISLWFARKGMLLPDASEEAPAVDSPAEVG
jgi:MFS family permease